MPVTHGHGNPDWSREETILALALVQQHWPKIPGKRSPEVKALSDLIRRLPIHAGVHKNEKFRNPDGVYLKLQNLASLHPEKADRKGLRTSHTDRAVWDELGADPRRTRLLADQIAKGIDVIESDPIDAIEDDDDFEAVEGAMLTRVHRRRERERGFRSRVVRRIEKAYGVVRCEACEAVAMLAGPIGVSMFEVHHLAPLSNAATTVTRLEDLALLCANCHRLIHAAMRHDDRHYGLADFRKWLAQSRSVRGDAKRKGSR
jgi:5-methylcytosine-specific restriction protein A